MRRRRRRRCLLFCQKVGPAPPSLTPLKIFGFWQTSSASKYCIILQHLQKKFSTSFLFMDHPLKTSAIFHDFWPLPPPVGSFLLLSVGKFEEFLTPPPYADVLNGWSLIWNRGSFRIKLIYFRSFKGPLFYKQENVRKLLLHARLYSEAALETLKGLMSFSSNYLSQGHSGFYCTV